MENHESTAREAFNKMAQLCSRSEQCSADIRKKIAAYDIVEEVIEEIIAKLKSEKFLDDDRYVHAYISDKIRLNKWGRIKMRYYLKAKGLPDTVIEKGLNEIDMEHYKKVLLATMNEKAKKVKKESKYEQASHIIRFAQSRGFEPEIIHRYLGEVVK
ncbi:MAG TPA: RecX family transcriptional regulator [Prolixibacteraceae bacterium]|nr:RecX family transcriptional regulator [Prolixibacteraceae bacterium]